MQTQTAVKIPPTRPNLDARYLASILLISDIAESNLLSSVADAQSLRKALRTILMLTQEVR